MELEEAKKTLKFEIDFENFCMKVDHYASNEKLKTIVEAIDTVIAELHSMQNLLDEKNEELDRLQKENEELKEIDLTTVHIKGVCDEKERWRNKIREKIEEYKNSKEFYQNFPDDYMGDIAISLLQDLLREE